MKLLLFLVAYLLLLTGFCITECSDQGITFDNQLSSHQRKVCSLPINFKANKAGSIRFKIDYILKNRTVYLVIKLSFYVFADKESSSPSIFFKLWNDSTKALRAYDCGSFSELVTAALYIVVLRIVCTLPICGNYKINQILSFAAVIFWDAVAWRKYRTSGMLTTVGKSFVVFWFCDDVLHVSYSDFFHTDRAVHIAAPSCRSAKYSALQVLEL